MVMGARVTTLQDLEQESGMNWLKMCRYLGTKWHLDELEPETLAHYRELLAARPAVKPSPERPVSKVKTAEQRELGKRLALAAYERNTDPTDWQTVSDLADVITEARKARWTWKLIAEHVGCSPQVAKNWADGIPVLRATGTTKMQRAMRQRF